ncbi:SGM_5486 family transporter-associated protein [Kitasatospora sp. NPDC004531]
MPVLDPNPQGGQKKLLQMLAVIGGIVVLLAIIATVAQSMG